MAQSLTHRPLVGLALISLGVLGFVGSEVTIKALAASYSVPFINLVRYAVHVAVLGLLVGPRVGARLWQTERTGMVILRGVILSVGSLFMGLALARMPVAETVAIFYLAPFLVLLLSARLLGERVARAGWVAAAVGFAGVVLILRPGSGLDPVGVIFALANAVVIALYTLMSRLLSRSETALAMLFMTAASGTVVFAAMVLVTGTGPLPDARGWAGLALFAALTLGGHYALTVAYRFAPAGLLAPATYIHLVWAAALGWLIFGDLPDLIGFGGIALIITAGIGLTLSARRDERKARLATLAEMD